MARGGANGRMLRGQVRRAVSAVPCVACSGCGAEVAPGAGPLTCQACGSTRWELLPWRPFSASAKKIHGRAAVS